MNKTFKIVESYLGNKNIKAYKNGKKFLILFLTNIISTALLKFFQLLVID
jgi:hypothetical protein